MLMLAFFGLSVIVSISGKSIAKGLISAFFGRAEYLAALQILWDLSRDPKAGTVAVDAVLGHSVGLQDRWIDLFRDAIAADGGDTEVKAKMAYDLMWGHAVENATTAYLADVRLEGFRPPNEIRIELLLDAIEGMLDTKI